MNAYRRVAFLPDTFHEVNGVAHTSRHLEQFARRRQIPFLSVHPGPKPGLTKDGLVSILEVKRSPLAFALDTNLDCDPTMFRHAHRVIGEAKRMGVELIHITGPGDMGLLGCYAAWRLHVPLVMGWHTNLHEYAGKRLGRLVSFAPEKAAEQMVDLGERAALSLLEYFYGRARAILAPNDELVRFVGELSARPTYLMGRGVDTDLFTPARRVRAGARFRIGYVGRLTPEKNVRLLADLGKALYQSAKRNFEFYIVGQGSEREWLQTNVPNIILPGVLTGEELARAYANMDLFVFPSTTDTFGNVVLEALASGVPCIVTESGGPKFLVQPGVTGYIAADLAGFVRAASSLMTNLDAHHAMREAARHYAQGRSWDRVFESVFRVYNFCVASKAPGNTTAARDSFLLSA